jgi:hypothetical protein
MKKLSTVISLVILLSLQAYSLQEDFTTPAFTITNMVLTGTPNIGDTLRLDVAFHSNIDQNFNLNLFFSDQIKPLNWQSTERMQSDTMTLDSGTTQIKTYYLLVEGTGLTNLSFSGAMNTFSLIHNNGNPKNVLIKSGTNPFVRTLNDDVDDNINSYTENLNPLWPEGSNSFKVTGTCTYIYH